MQESMSSKTVFSAPHVAKNRAYGMNRIKRNTIAISAGILNEGYGQKVQFQPEGNGVIYAKRGLEHAHILHRHTHTHTHPHIHQSHSHPFSISERKRKHICLPQMRKCVRLSAQWLKRAVGKDKGKIRGKGLPRNREGWKGVRRRFERCNFVPINFPAQTFWAINRAWRLCGVVGRRGIGVCLCVC